MIKAIKIVLILVLICLGELLHAQQIPPVVELNKPETHPRIVRATEVIRLLPGFVGQAGFTARIVEEYTFDHVIGEAYNLNENRNWIASSSYDLSGRLTSSEIGYYNSLGKATQSQSLDIKTGKVWASEIRYDEYGRPAFSSLSAPVDSLKYGYRADFLTKSNGSLFAQEDLESIVDNASDIAMSTEKNKVGWYYSENNDSEKYQDITSYPYNRTIYSTLNPGLPLKVLGGNKIKKTANDNEEWLQSYSFDMPMAQEIFNEFGKDYFPERDEITLINKSGRKPFAYNDRNGYYSYTLQENCNGRVFENIRLDNGYQIYIGSVYKLSVTVMNPSTNRSETINGFFKVNDKEQHFNSDGPIDLFLSPSDSFENENIVKRESVPTPIGISSFAYLLDRNNAYHCPLGRPYFLRGTKTVIRDVHGIENVVFKDSEGNVLAAARSGNEDGKSPIPYTMISPIGEQKYVDIHIPVGCGGTNAVKLTGPSGTRFKIYDLVSDKFLKYANIGSLTLNPGMYRFQVITEYKPLYPYVTYKPALQVLHSSSTAAVEYKINYYDYSLNYYDKAGRLEKSTQPLNKGLETIFTYNTLGQLLETESPDEGKAKFKYRKDGKIRFSQNSKQKKVNEFSYTNYDSYGRPVESGVATGTYSSLNPDIISFSGTKKEQHFTVYDEADQSGLDTALATANIGANVSKYKQQFVAGNVVKTYTNNPKTNTTWYGYDIYGRVAWMVQEIEGLGTKTIDYEFDFATGQVTKVYYQKYNTNEQFVHRYTYNIAGELFLVETSTDDKRFDEQAKYIYYETGALKRTEIAENIQGIDYIYNLNGQLKAINHPSTDSSLDPGKDGKNGIARDLFGIAIDYYNGDYSRSNTPTPVTSNTSLYVNNQYNGNIKATRWSNGSIDNRKQVSQVYSYNKNNWLQTADFGSANNTGAITKNTYNNYRVYGLDYDANGNIQKLNRNKDGNANNVMDRMVYNYKADKPNQLSHIDDPINASVEDMVDQDVNNYEYNDIGQLVKNKQEGIEYFYNASGLVIEIKKDGNTYVKFYYDDRGNRIRKESNFSGTNTDITYYLRDASGNPIAIISSRKNTSEDPNIEHLIYGENRLGIFNKKGSSTSSIYQLTDHLGNVRAVVGKDRQGNVIAKNAIDYYPFGMTMPNRQIVNGEPYRYAYQGQEKDVETGKEAFHLRLWDARIGRWLTTDPKSEFNSPYLGMANNPINKIDPDGGETVPVKGDEKHQKALVNQVNEVTGGNYHVVDGNLEAIEGNYGTGENAVLFKSAIEATYDIPINAVYGTNVAFDSFATADVDVQDLSNVSKELRAAIYAHFMTERTLAGKKYSNKNFRRTSILPTIGIMGNKEEPIFDFYHREGLKAETRVLESYLDLGLTESDIRKKTDLTISYGKHLSYELIMLNGNVYKFGRIKK